MNMANLPKRIEEKFLNSGKSRHKKTVCISTDGSNFIQTLFLNHQFMIDNSI